MRSYLLLAIACGLAVVTGCSSGKPTAAGNPAEVNKPRLRVLCGSSMAKPVEVIGKLFAEQRGADVEYDFGGSETLLPKVLAGAVADIYVCHDPFEEKVRAGGQLAGTAEVGFLEPVLAVKPGNPKQIRGIEDLAKAEIKLGIGDPRYSTCGEMFVAMLQEKGLKEKVMPQVAVQLRTHVELANGLIAGPLDAVVIWNFAAALYKDKLEVVAVDARYQPVRVTVLGLAKSGDAALRDAFLEFCRTEKARALFKEHGYTSSGTK